MSLVDIPDSCRAVTVGPDQYLVLVPQRAMSPAHVRHLGRQLPDELAGRVLIVHDVDAFVVSKGGGDQ